MMKNLEQEIYQEILVFLDAYIAENAFVLKERFDIHGEFLEEIYEMLDFVKDKNSLHICDIDEFSKRINGGTYFEIFDFDEYSDSFPNKGVECMLFMDKEHIGYIKGEYQIDGSFPKFLFRYFSV